MIDRIVFSYLAKQASDSSEKIVLEMAEKLETILKKHGVDYSKKRNQLRNRDSIEFKADIGNYAIRFEVMHGYGAGKELPNPYVLMGGYEKQGDRTYYTRESFPKGEKLYRRPYDILTEEDKILKYAEYLINVYLKDDHTDPEIVKEQLYKEYKRIKDVYSKCYNDLSNFHDKFVLFVNESMYQGIRVTENDSSKVPKKLYDLHLESIRLNSTGSDIFRSIDKFLVPNFSEGLVKSIKNSLKKWEYDTKDMSYKIEEILKDKELLAKLSILNSTRTGKKEDNYSD